VGCQIEDSFTFGCLLFKPILHRFAIEKKGIFRENMLTCMEIMLEEYDDEGQAVKEKIMEELWHYQSSEGSFERPLAKKQGSNRHLNPGLNPYLTLYVVYLIYL
jgi:hypothetical protein